MIAGINTKTRIAAVILAAAVLLLLFVDWLAIGGETKKEWDDARSDIEYFVEKIESYGQWIDMDLDLNAISIAARQMLNGKLTPAEIFSISGTGRNAVRTLYKAVGRYFMQEKDYRTFMVLTGCYRAVFILAAVSILLSLFIRASGKLVKLDYIMIVFVGILFIVICAVSAALSSRGIKLDITVFTLLALICTLPLNIIGKIPFLR